MSEETGACEVCDIQSKRKCSSCKLVFYCSQEHQQADWKEHKSICKPFVEDYSKDIGRHLKATRALKPGDVIFSEAPLVFGPKPHRIEAGAFPCVGCCRLLEDQSCERCPGCLWPVCNAKCSGLNTPDRHGFECQILRLRPSTELTSFYQFYRFDVLIVLRAMYLQKANPKKWDVISKLEDHYECRGPGTEVYKDVEEKFGVLEANYLKPLRDFERNTGRSIVLDASPAIVHRIYGVLDVNATELTEDIDATILYATASLMEHNCTPNVMQLIDETERFTVTVRAALPIEKGDHVSSIYTHILWGTAARREHLLRTKYFGCCCKRCADPTELGTNLSALKCIGGVEGDLCGGVQLPLRPTLMEGAWRCDKCSIELPEKDVMKFVNHLGEQVDKVMSKVPRLRELEDVLGKLEHFLHPNHYLIYNVKHSLVQLLGTEENVEYSVDDWLKKMNLCEELIAITKTLDPGNARLSLYLGVLLNELFIAQFKILTRTWENPTQNLYTEQLKGYIVNTIEENKRVLEYERRTVSGNKLYEIVVKNEQIYSSWCELNSQ
ncbi:unnamed protein product [Phyllotreta striolata]|uniref:MYND-type domain-containing protein n=1 Tax=Phyllotreta striolata TaxID=444603 RepID=A0A9N9TEP2_PHYSR|nr:unnamed protein product [Phyllotreta striolata]